MKRICSYQTSDVADLFLTEKHLRSPNGLNKPKIGKTMNVLRNRVVMVAGGAGFIGSALVRELLDYGARVVSYDNYLHGNPSNLENLAGPLIKVKGSVLNEQRLLQTIENHDIDYVINCTGDPFIPTAYKMPQRC